jgi:hypothetical protein
MQSAARARDEKRFCSSAHRQPEAFCVSPFRLMPLPPPLLVRIIAFCSECKQTGVFISCIVYIRGL